MATVIDNDDTQEETPIQKITKNEKPVQVLSWSPYGTWSFQATYGDCPICKKYLEESCIQCLESSQGNITCDASRGKCGHCFHKHCIDKWTEKSQICPVCANPYATDVRNMNNNSDWIKLMKK